MWFSRRHVYKFRQRKLFFSEVPKVDVFDFGTKLFNSGETKQKSGSVFYYMLIFVLRIKQYNYILLNIICFFHFNATYISKFCTYILLFYI